MKHFVSVLAFAAFMFPPARAHAGVTTASLVNGGFETDGLIYYSRTNAITGWSYATNGVFMRQVATSNYFAHWVTEGSYSLWVWNSASATMRNGDYASVSQSVNLTGIGAIEFDVSLSNGMTGGWNGDGVVEFLVDGVSGWSAGTVGTYRDRHVNVSGFPGIHTIAFRLRMARAFSGRSNWMFVDNVRMVAMKSLAVYGDPLNAGSPSPFGYGTNYCNLGTVLTDAVEAVVQAGAGSRYVSQGWTGTGSVPGSGNTNRVMCTITDDSTLTWKWQAEHYLTFAFTNGTISGADAGWKPQGALCSMAPSNAFGYAFEYWELNGTNVGSVVPLVIAMDGPRAVAAVFGTVFVDVSSSVSSHIVNWSLNRQTGTFFGDLGLSNSSVSPKGLLQPFWYVVESNQTQRLMHPSGIEPQSGFPYVDMTARILGSLPGVGNGDLVLDPGESVTVSGIEFYSRNRTIPTGFFVAVWADPPSEATLLTNRGSPERWVDVKSGNGRVWLQWVGADSSTQYLEMSEDLVSWRPILTNTLAGAVTNSFEGRGGSRAFFRIRETPR